MNTFDTVTLSIPYAITRFYDGGLERYAGDVVYCDLIAGEVTPASAAELDQQLIAEASGVLGQPAQIARIVRCVDLAYGEVLKVFFEAAAKGGPACHLDDHGAGWFVDEEQALAA